MRITGNRRANLPSSATIGVTFTVTSARITATERTDTSRSAMEAMSAPIVGAANAVVKAPKAMAAVRARDLKENIFL